MARYETIIRGGMVVLPDEVRALDLGIEAGKIVEMRKGLAGGAGEVIDATHLHVFPGVIDSHVHFNEPGRTEWEGIQSGSRALAAGGGTCFFDMPLNSHPPVIDGDSFDRKLAAAEASSVVDFAFWGGLVPQNLDELETLAERGVVGFKAFMSNSGIDDFPHVDDLSLREGMKRAARLGKIVAVHAESEGITSSLTARQLAAGKTSIRDYLDSRPIEAELDAISRALEMAGETRCALHIVHVSCGAGIALIASARKMGVNVTCETCPHYLVLTEEDVVRIGAAAKCAPPLRAQSAQKGLWEYLKAGQIQTIGSDHSPAPPGMKRDSNFFKVWGGISGAQHTLPLLLTEGHVNRQTALPLVARLFSLNVVSRFRLPHEKGRISPGADADLALVNLDEQIEVRDEELFYRHRQSPYLGRKLRGQVVQTFVRGRTVFRHPGSFSTDVGRLVKPVQT